MNEPKNEQTGKSLSDLLSMLDDSDKPKDTAVDRLNRLLKKLAAEEATEECVETENKQLPINPPATGWICPACGRGNAPSNMTCPRRPVPALHPMPYTPYDPYSPHNPFNHPFPAWSDWGTWC